MKNIIFYALVVLFSLAAQTLIAQAPPQKMTYQFVARNGQNQLIQNNAVGLRISILQGSTSGAAVYVETHTPQTNGNGTATIEVGAGTVVSGIFANIDWSTGVYFIQTEMDPQGQQGYSITAVSQLLSVPYAFYAGRATYADSVVGGNGGSIGFNHYIGEFFDGGVIFHLWKDAQGVEHGLIVTTTEQGTASWSNITSSIIGLTAQSTWDGIGNCNAIISQPGHTNSAASLCLTLNNGGFNDWYLPSIDELSLLWHSRFNVNKTLSTIIGAEQMQLNATYTCSTEKDATMHFNLNTGIGATNAGNKTSSTYYVRAIRKF